MVEDREYGIKVKLLTPDHFLLCKESLTRIGVGNSKDMKLYQTAHILHRRGNYFIVHFKELFALDGKPTQITYDDYCRRNLIVKLLSDWKLLEVDDKNFDHVDVAPLASIKIISHKEKSEWELIPKYQLGSNKFKRSS